MMTLSDSLDRIEQSTATIAYELNLSAVAVLLKHVDGFHGIGMPERNFETDDFRHLLRKRAGQIA